MIERLSVIYELNQWTSIGDLASIRCMIRTDRCAILNIDAEEF